MSGLNRYFPTKTMRVGRQEKPFINHELKTIKRRKLREYVKNGKTLKYRKLAKEFSTKYKVAAQKFIRKKVDELRDSQPGKAFNVLKSLGAKPGDSDSNQFTLPNHVGLTSRESAEKIAEHFASISNEYSPLNVSELSGKVKERLNDGITPPTVTEIECY